MKIISDRALNRIYVILTDKLQRKPKATKKDIINIVCCKLNENFSLMHSTRLYNKYPQEYCRLLEVIEEYFD